MDEPSQRRNTLRPFQTSKLFKRIKINKRWGFKCLGRYQSSKYLNFYKNKGATICGRDFSPELSLNLELNWNCPIDHFLKMTCINLTLRLCEGRPCSSQTASQVNLLAQRTVMNWDASWWNVNKNNFCVNTTCRLADEVFLLSWVKQNH